MFLIHFLVQGQPSWQQTGRVCYGIELDEKFVDVIVKRYMESTSNRDVSVLRNGETLSYDQALEVMEEHS